MKSIASVLHFVARSRTSHLGRRFEALSYNKGLPSVIRWIPHFSLLWSRRRARRLFDAAFYLQKYPDVAAAQMNPWLHYLKHGIAEGRKPNPLFEPDYYLTMCPEARSSGSGPLMYFVEAPGGGASPHPLFDCEAYRRTHPEIITKGRNPLVHYFSRRSSGTPVTEGGYFGAN